MIKNKDLANLLGLMGENTQVNGKMACKMGKENILMNLAKLKKVFGLMENLFNELYLFFIII